MALYSELPPTRKPTTRTVCAEPQRQQRKALWWKKEKAQIAFYFYFFSLGMLVN